MMNDEAIEMLNEFFAEFDIGAEGEAWQTLKPIVLAQQSNNTIKVETFKPCGNCRHSNSDLCAICPIYNYYSPMA